MTIAQQRRLILSLRAGADAEDRLAAIGRHLACALHGVARHDAGFAMERRAERQEAAAGRLRERAAELEASVRLRLQLLEPMR